MYPSKHTQATKQQILRLHEDGVAKKAIARLLGINPGSVHYWITRAKQQTGGYFNVDKYYAKNYTI